MTMYKGSSWFCKFVSMFHEHVFHTIFRPSPFIFGTWGDQETSMAWVLSDTLTLPTTMDLDDLMTICFSKTIIFFTNLSLLNHDIFNYIIHSVHIIHSAYVYTPRQFKTEPGNTWKRIIFPTSQPSGVLDSPCFATGSQMMAEPSTKTWRLAVGHRKLTRFLGGVMEEQR